MNNTKFDNLVKAATKCPGFKEVVEGKRMLHSAPVGRRVVQERGFKRESSTTLSFHELKGPFLAAQAGNKVSSKAIHGKGLVAIPQYLAIDTDRWVDQGYKLVEDLKKRVRVS